MAWHCVPIAVVLPLVLVSCAGGTSVTTVTSTTAVAQPETTTSTEAAAELPLSPVTAELGLDQGNTYKVDLQTFESLPFDESELPVAPGSVEVRWYTSGDVYAVAYVGLDLAQTGPLCPGNSILTPAGQFEHGTNAPTEEGACEGFTTVSDDPAVGPQPCGDSVVYLTAIPSTEEGTLFGTVEDLADDGSAIVGLTSQSETSDEIPELDVSGVCGP